MNKIKQSPPIVDSKGTKILFTISRPRSLAPIALLKLVRVYWVPNLNSRPISATKIFGYGLPFFQKYRFSISGRRGHSYIQIKAKETGIATDK